MPNEEEIGALCHAIDRGFDLAFEAGQVEPPRNRLIVARDSERTGSTLPH